MRTRQEIDQSLLGGGITRFQQAIDTANSGLKLAAYQQFCLIYQHGNTEDVTLLYWLAFTTPNLQECEYTINTIARLDPDHPKLLELYTFLGRRRAQVMQHVSSHVYGPTLTCPYCHITSPTLVKSKVSTGGWILLIVLLILCFPLFWIGLLIREDYRVCSHCGSKLG